MANGNPVLFFALRERSATPFRHIQNWGHCCLESKWPHVDKCASRLPAHASHGSGPPVVNTTLRVLPFNSNLPSPQCRGPFELASSMGYGNSGSWSDGGSWNSKLYKLSNSWKNHLVCASCGNWVYELRAQKN